MKESQRYDVEYVSDTLKSDDQLKITGMTGNYKCVEGHALL